MGIGNSKTTSCTVCGKPRVRRADGICSDCAPGYYGTAARCSLCGDATRAADRVCVDCRAGAVTPASRRTLDTVVQIARGGLPRR